MKEDGQACVLSQEEAIENLAKLLKERHGALYEQILSGQRTLLLVKIAARFGLTEDILRDEIATFEAASICSDVEMESNKMKELQELVINMQYAP